MRCSLSVRPEILSGRKTLCIEVERLLKVLRDTDVRLFRPGHYVIWLLCSSSFALKNLNARIIMPDKIIVKQRSCPIVNGPKMNPNC